MIDSEIQLNAAKGFLLGGMLQDAWDQREEIEPELRATKEVLSLRVKILMAMEKWEFSLEIANALCRSFPDSVTAVVEAANCLHKLGKTKEAREKMMAAPGEKWGSAVWHFDMARFECQLGDLETAKFYLQEATMKNNGYAQIALHEPDLKPLW